VLRWEAKAVYGEGTPKTASAHLVPLFTIADPETLHPPRPPGGNERQVVLALVGENTVPPEARTAAEVAEVAVEHVHLLDEDDLACMPRMIDAFLRWAAAAGAGVTGSGQISVVQLQDLLADLADPEFRQKTFAYENVSQFLEKSLHLRVVGYPPTGTPPETSGTSGSFVPMAPEISTETTVGTATSKWDFATEPAIEDPYPANLDAYFQQLAAERDANAADDPFEPAPERTGAVLGDEAESSPPSLSKLLFGDYFAVLTRAALQGAIDLLSAYPYDYDLEGRKSLAGIAGDFGSAELEGLLGVAVTAVTVAEDCRDVALASGLEFGVTELPYQVRSGQSLKDVAAAAPAPKSALTGAGVAERNQAVEGLLRTGGTLKVPAHECTRMENDGDGFLKAFFAVRAAGDGGVEGVSEEMLAWYEQAISLLNGDVVWSEVAVGRKIEVPSGYRDSTPAAAEYPVHPRDTLPRIAATFARLHLEKGAYTPSPAGGKYPVPELSREIAVTDTFRRLAEDFPGLELAELAEANEEEAVLAPLATLTLPDYTARIGDDQTPAKLAEAFDLDLAGLVDLLGEVEGIFAAKSKLAIRDVPARPLDTLLEDLLASEQANSVAVQTSRFLMHGMRMPAPDDQQFLSLTPEQVREGGFTGSLYSLYELNGQQTRWPDPKEKVDVLLRKSKAPWLSFAESAVEEGKLRIDEAVDQLSLAITQTRFGEDLPDTTLELGVEAPQPMPPFETHEVHRNLQAHIHWQAAEPPALPSGGGTAQPGEPAIWPFTSEMLAVAAGAGSGSTPAYGLFSTPLDAPPGTGESPLKSYAWAVRIPISLQRVAGAPSPGASQRWLERVYLLGGADHDGAERLLALLRHLEAPESHEAKVDLFLAYPPNATEPNPSGLASDALDPLQTYVLQTNLSTDTRQPETAADVLGAGYSGSIKPAGELPTGFLGLLWKASVVNPGGFYLHYAAKGGAGLPDSVFDESGHGKVELVCLLGSQAGGDASGGSLLSFNNAAVVDDNLDAAAAQVYAKQTAAGGPTVQVPTLPPGSLGFTMLRTKPLDTDLAGRLYNLVGFQLAGTGPFRGSNESLPVGPSPAPAPDAGKLLYHQVFNAAKRVKDEYRPPQHCAALPPSADDPYAGIGKGPASISFAEHDVL
ncbi:MAG: hypothetical protein M3335_09260, partial [Actinomycetota bacterium]|nr:hypothetical protein [Actinomycetota bacterium]